MVIPFPDNDENMNSSGVQYILFTSSYSVNLYLAGDLGLYK